MDINEILVERSCPSCQNRDATLLFSLNKDQFFYNNPTHNLEWFNKLEIPQSFLFPFVQCKKCEFVFSRFKLNDAYNFAFYNEGIDVETSKEKIYRKSKRVAQVQMWLNLLRLAEEKKYLKVLDFGGGWGDFLATAKSFGVEAFGLEFDERKIEFARSQGVSLNDMEFIDNHAPYDIFMCNQVMEHLDDPKSAMKHLRSLVVKNAVGFVGVPNFNRSYLNENIRLIRNGGVPPKEINPLGHLNYFSPESLVRMLHETGFEVVSLKKKSKPEGLAAKAMKIFKPGPSEFPDSTMLYVKAV